MSSLILLRSCDGVLFEVEEAVAKELKTISFMIEGGCSRPEIPLPNVDSKTLAKVIEYCRKHVTSSSNDNDNDNDNDDKDEDDLKSWDANYIRVFDSATLYSLFIAANYLDNEGLLNLAAQAVADMIEGKTVEEIRKTFNIKNDLTSEEEEEIQRENRWAFD